MNSAQIYNKAIDDVWEIFRTALFNYIYHDDMAAHYDRVAFWLRIVTPTLIILGIFTAMLQPPPVEKVGERRKRVTKNNAIAFLLAIASIVTWDLTPDGKLAEHQVLSKQWLAVTAQVKTLRTDLHAIGPTKEDVPAKMLAEIAFFKDQTSALMQGEMDPTDKAVYALATVQTRQQIYGEEIVTKTQAVEEYRKRKEQKLIPVRSEEEGGAKKGVSGQSLVPKSPASTVVTAH